MCKKKNHHSLNGGFKFKKIIVSLILVAIRLYVIKYFKVLLLRNNTLLQDNFELLCLFLSFLIQTSNIVLFVPACFNNSVLSLSSRALLIERSLFVFVYFHFIIKKSTYYKYRYPYSA